MMNQDTAICEVNAVPLQAKCLAAAQAVARGYLDKRKHGIILHSGKEPVKLFRAVEVCFIAFFAWKHGELAEVC